MTALLKAALGRIAADSAWFLLLAMGAVAAYLWAQLGAARADRDQLSAWATTVCADAGALFAAGTSAETTTDGKRVTVDHGRGEVCRVQIRALAAYRHDTEAGTARLLAQHAQDQADKSKADLATARAAALAAEAAAQHMEEQNAAITDDDRVGPGWFGALNDLAGLRAPIR